MASVSTYLNFKRETEEAFNFYRQVFQSEFEGGIMRYRELPDQEQMPGLAEEDKDLVMHVSLPILSGHYLMGTDTPDSTGFRLSQGNNIYINLMPDTREETRRLFQLLSEGGKVEQELQDMFWGDYYGSCQDKFGIHWMFNCSEKE